MAATAPRKHEVPQIPPEFIIRLPQAKNKEFITANGLIYLGHLQGLKRVDVQIIQAPTHDNASAIVRCEVETDLGVFSDYGEVSPINKGTVGGTYPLSMATTRARNRALRIATGCPLTSYEEMGMERDEEDEQPAKSQPKQATAKPSLQVVPKAEEAPEDPNNPAANDPLVQIYTRLIQAQIAINNLVGRVEPVDEGMTLSQAETRLKELSEIHMKLKAGKSAPADPNAAPATKDQITKLHKLQATAGQPGSVAADITSEEAARQIGELVAILNKRSATAKRG